VTILDESGRQRDGFLSVERALTVRVDGHALVTLMTLGGWPEMLVLGYLFNQGLIRSAGALESIAVDWHSGGAEVFTRPGTADIGDLSARRAVTSGCGLGSVLSDLAFDQDPHPRAVSSESTRLAYSTLIAMLETMRGHQHMHHAAGSVHSCALFRGADLLLAVEDVSRHNGIDTICGWMRMYGVTGDDKILFSTGRLTGEMVLKAARNGVPIMVSRNGASAMGYDLAIRFGMTLIGRAANRRFLCYTGAKRLVLDVAAAQTAASD
jgi:FdhD protein